MLLVTGGAGFIGSTFVLSTLAHTGEPIVTLDKLTYAGSLRNLATLEGRPEHRFVRGDILDRALVRSLLEAHRPRAVIHLAAETHVDRSITGPADFIRANVEGTFCLLEECRTYWQALEGEARDRFRFLNVSTDEVYGELGRSAPPWSESAPYAPGNPYAASKAAADHLARAYHRTYGMPILITASCNTYGPRQFPEKLIPRVIRAALAGEPLPVYGDGSHVRDWLHVDDHCAALRLVLEKGRAGESYNIGAGNERQNIELVRELCALLDRTHPREGGHAARIAFVADRPGHDRRYALDSGKIARELGWRAAQDLASGLRATVEWYLAHP